jgi:WD40 repeat protein
LTVFYCEQGGKNRVVFHTNTVRGEYFSKWGWVRRIGCNKRGLLMKRFVWGLVVIAGVLVLFTGASESDSVAGNDQAEESGLEVEVFPQLGHSDYIYSVAYSPDGKYALSGATDGTLRFWDIDTGREIRTFEYHQDAILSVSISPDGKYALSGSSSGTLKLWDIEIGQVIRSFSGHTKQVISVAFSPDGKYALSGSDDWTIKLWDIATGEEVRTYKSHIFGVKSIVFSPDQKYILSGSLDGIILWDIATGQLIRTSEGVFDGLVHPVTISPDGKYALSSSRDRRILKLWDIATDQVLKVFEGHSSDIEFVIFSPNGEYALSGSNSGVILWDIATGQMFRTIQMRRTLTGHTHFVESIAISPDGKYILSGSMDETLKLWDITTGNMIRTFTGHTDRVGSVSFSPNGEQVVSGSYDNTIKLWDVSTGQKVRTFEGHASSIWSVAFSPDGEQVVSGSWDKTIKLWDIATGREVRTFEGHTQYVLSVSFSPDGKYILSGSGDDTLKLWDIATGEEIRTFEGHTFSVDSVTFSPDGKYILSGGDRTIKMWDIDTGQVIRTFTGHKDLVQSIAISLDGKYVVSGAGIYFNNEDTLKLWDIATGLEIRNFIGHTGWVVSVTISRDGKFILSSSQDGTIKLWDIATSQEIRTFSEHTNSVSSVSFSPDGTQVLSGSYDGTTRIWDVATGKEIAAFISFSGSDTQLTGGTRDLVPSVETAATSIDGEWVVITPDGYYAASPQGDRYLNVRVGNTVTGIDSFRSVFYNPDVVRARLAGEPDPPSKATVTIQQAAAFMPPEVSLQTETRTASSSTANISLSIADKNLPIQNIIVMVNGRRLGAEELAAISGASGLQPNRASLTVTGNQRTLNLTLPVNLDPGDNRIEVVAFNGYSENRRYIDITWNAPTGTKPSLPDLWILAVGVNKYDNAGAGLGNLRDLNYCVADARGVIDSLRAQEGVRYGKVHSLLVADDADVKPTAVNIRQSFKFLEDAKPRDVVLLFLAGHGVSAQESKFFFLPRDASISTGKTVDPSRAISGDEIVSILDAPGNRLVFIDACQAGGVDNDRMVRSLMDTNAFVFAACRGNESSLELPNLGHGVFTYSIMDALKGAVQAQAAGNVSVISMSGFVSIDVPRRTANRQNPKAYSLGFYDFPMAVAK